MKHTTKQTAEMMSCRNIFKTSLFILFLLPLLNLQAQDVTGKWKTIDDNTGEERSIVEIYEEEGEYFGRIEEVLAEDADELCGNCKGDKKDQPLAGLVIIEGLNREGEVYEGGTILDPANGNVYNCKMELEDSDTLKVRGYRGISLLGRTQVWHRVE